MTLINYQVNSETGYSLSNIFSDVEIYVWITYFSNSVTIFWHEYNNFKFLTFHHTIIETRECHMHQNLVHCISIGIQCRLYHEAKQAISQSLYLYTSIHCTCAIYKIIICQGTCRQRHITMPCLKKVI